MKVKMLTASAGPKGVRRVGQIVDVSPDEAAQLIKGRHASALHDVPVETASAKPRGDEETAALHKKK